jgi:cation transport protein ChaC
MVRLHGWHRSFCVLSHGYRGTVDCPGLVLGLDQGGECVGMAYRVCGRTQLEEAVEYLWVREMVTGIYNPTLLPATVDDGRTVQCWAFVVDRAHQQYMGHLSQERRADMISTACGTRGPNRTYLENTVKRLHQLGVDDESLTSMLDRVHDAEGKTED